MRRDDQELQEFIFKMKEQQGELFKQAKEQNLTQESMEHVLYDLCKNIAAIMHADRISIWLFNHDQTVLTEHMTYAVAPFSPSATRVLDAHHAKDYFDTIVTRRVNPVMDIATNPSMQGLQSDYFSQTAMTSLIDAAIIMSRGIGGMLCCETAERREWSQLDEVIMAAIADMLSFVFDRIQRIEMEDEMHRLAYTDFLTGIDNENAFIEKVNNRIVMSGGKVRGAFLYMKMDQFTAIQSVLGPAGVQIILKEMALRLKKEFPEDTIIARIAFDHFILYTENVGGPLENRMQMEQILSRLQTPLLVEEQQVFLTFSYGVALMPEHVHSAYEGIQASKTALDSSQKSGDRKTRAVYEPIMFKQWEQEMHSEMNLGKALERGEFCLFYQPQVESITHRMTGVEALIRWKHPEKGLLAPGAFIGVAETTGLIFQIGEWVLKQACQQLREWADRGFEKLSISVNISPNHFLHHRFPAFLEECIRTYDVNPLRLVLEITENVAFENFDLVEAQIQRLRRLGLSISIDDFGTGYSAFIYLQHFTIQEVKIDRQFVRNVETDVKSRAIVRAIVTLAKSLHMHTVAEGVETKGQLLKLEEMGCFELQGYYFGKPISIEELNSLMEASPQFPSLHLPGSAL